jgi:hypothetical protein
MESRQMRATMNRALEFFLNLRGWFVHVTVEEQRELRPVGPGDPGELLPPKPDVVFLNLAQQLQGVVRRLV